MKLYKLEEKEDAPKNTIGEYDTYDSFVVRAETEERARELAYEESSMEEWKDPAITVCTPLKNEGEEEIILGSFNAG